MGTYTLGMKTWTFAEARPPAGGPWDTEPDKAQWVDDLTGLDCLIVRHAEWGNLCGYVGLPPGHRLYGVAYGQLPDLDAHRGVNYTSLCQDGAEDGPGICHVPEPGRAHDVWWLGFDCGHDIDYRPSIDANHKKLGINLAWDAGGDPLNYRTFEYVQGEVRRLALQLAEIK